MTAHNQLLLNEYFANHWVARSSLIMSSHSKIAEKLNPADWLLDVGCGDNQFKKLHSQVVGVDPANEAADVMCTIEEFQSDKKFDVATCLGSINFGTHDIIAKQIEKVMQLLNDKARVFWRLNPGRQDHDHPLADQIYFYPWTFEQLKEFADKYGFQQVNSLVEEHERRPRLYSEWIRT